MNNPHDKSTKSTAARLAAAQVKAEARTEALPSIATLPGVTLDVIHGGNATAAPQVPPTMAEDLAFLRCAAIRPVVVHGGGPQISAMLEPLGVEPAFKAGPRVMTEEAVEFL